ncbi:MAG TPA: ATP-binding cassette domain-containing protein [Firmicutes bacterium]|nr:ATP-binding cassette domain-containing protein [Bacillota bacterium]
MLTAENLTQTYDGRTVVQNFTFEFPPGKIYGVIGPNGAGKSTLLRLLSAMEKPLSGRVFFQEKPLVEPAPEICCVWQRPYLFQRTVAENIAYGLSIRKRNRQVARRRIEELLAIFKLQELRDQRASKLSGGETARVAIARALAVQPQVLILDEPTANLDPGNTRLVEKVIRRVHQEEGNTVIIVTHDMFQAKRLADITLYLSGGRLIESGCSRQVFGSPFSEETRRFINGEL